MAPSGVPANPLTAPPTFGVSRRGLLIAPIAAALAAACRSGAERPSPTAGAGSATPITVTHKFGRTEIKTTPTRLVTLGYTDQDAALALGVVPVGVQEFFPGYARGAGPWAESKLGSSTPEIFKGTNINYEQLTKIGPDLITVIQRDVSEQDYATLTRIAPTIAPPAGFVPFGVPWREQSLLIGRALGREDEMRRLIATVEGRFAAAKKDNPRFAGKTVVVALAGNDGVLFAYAKQDARTRFMEELGFTLAPAIDAIEKTTFYITVSREQVKLFEADVLIWLGSSAGALEAVRTDPLLGQLDVAKQGRVIYVGEQDITQAFSFSTILSIPYVIDTFVPRLAKVVA